MNDRLTLKHLDDESLGHLLQVPSDRESLPEKAYSPACLLQELGVGSEVFILRLRGKEEKSGFVPLEDLDDNISTNGAANLVVRTGQWLSLLRLTDAQGNSFKCVTLEYVHWVKAFFFWLCVTDSLSAFPLTVQEMWERSPEGVLVPSYKLTFVPVGEFPELNP